MNTNIIKNQQLNQNRRNSTNNGIAQRHMHFYNNNRMSQMNTQESPSTFKRHLTNHSTFGDDARYVSNKRQRQNSQENVEEFHDNEERIEEWFESNMHHGIMSNVNHADNDRSQTLISKQAVNYNYPHEINNIKNEPLLPKYLPPSYSILIKIVHNHISIDEIRQEVKEKYNSQYSCNKLIGTKTNRTRHVRVDFTDRNDYDTTLNIGQISFFSQLYSVNEFLEAPKLLICSKCNSPGHMKKECQLNYDRCRRCGCDRKTDHHFECAIKCHHCNGEHLSTDYKCPTVADYRCELVKELKRHPERLPEHVQLFIPAKCRDRNDRSHVITNYRKNEQKIDQ
ncbi:unnamed protein product [Rotaria sp. Silwood2]|nr:unnamed protein product [Rotaria sp. Silwood2]CAF4287573.1 unnamed protein product [Rotaria sp. Silwood2]